jgi:serine/threonine protein phosphatase PrpC
VSDGTGDHSGQAVDGIDAPTSWRFAWASVIGTSHIRDGLPCQDAASCFVVPGSNGMQALVAVVADGAGSAPRADEGAALACRVMTEVAAGCLLDGGLDRINATFAAEALEAVREAIKDRATEDGSGSRDFACTLLAAIIGLDRAAFLQVGDGVIVRKDEAAPGGWSWVFWPDRGEYANTTCFVTSPDAIERLQFTAIDGAVDEVALLSDGIQNMVLNMRERIAHPTFFERLSTPLRTRPSAGYDDEHSKAIADLFYSEMVNRRTDDDKTLVIASRRAAATQSFSTVMPLTEEPPAPSASVSQSSGRAAR